MSILIKKPVVVGREKGTVTSREKKEEYFWCATPDGYEVSFPNNGKASLKLVDGKWRMSISIGDFFLLGERTTLEAAFKALDQSLYRCNQAIWMKTRCRVVMEKFEDWSHTSDELYD